MSSFSRNFGNFACVELKDGQRNWIELGLFSSISSARYQEGKGSQEGFAAEFGFNAEARRTQRCAELVCLCETLRSPRLCVKKRCFTYSGEGPRSSRPNW